MHAILSQALPLLPRGGGETTGASSGIARLDSSPAHMLEQGSELRNVQEGLIQSAGLMGQVALPSHCPQSLVSLTDLRFHH